MDSDEGERASSQADIITIEEGYLWSLFR